MCSRSSTPKTGSIPGPLVAEPSGSLSPTTPGRRSLGEHRPRLQLEISEDVEDVEPGSTSVHSSGDPSTIISLRAHRGESRRSIRSSHTDRSSYEGVSSDSTRIWAENAAFWLSPTSASKKTSESSKRSRRCAINNLISADHSISDLISFRGSEDLLRGVPLGQVLRGGGHIFATSAGSEETYSLSQPVTNIQAFISHNWATPRYQKFFALSFHYNFDAAFLALASTCLLVGLLTLLDANPNQVWPSNTKPYPISVVARSVCPLLFFAVLFAKHDLQALFCGRMGPSIFLDKVCINQVDPELQARSIRKLGAFVCESEQVIALYSELYLRKLWTVYEVASFLVLRPEESIVIVAIWQVLIFLAVFLLFTLIQLSTVLMQVLAPFEAMLLLAGYMFGLGFMPTLRSWARIRGSLQSRLETFQVRECICTNEEDRPIVHENIAALLRASGAVAAEASLDEALGAFDRLVRNDLAKTFADALGRNGFEYKHYLCVATAVSGTRAADYMGRGNHGMPPREVMASLLSDLFWIGVAWPLIFMLTEHGAGSMLQLRGAAERLWVAVASFMYTIAPFGFFYYGLWYTNTLAAESDVMLLAYVVVDLAGSFAVYKLHRFFSSRSKDKIPSQLPGAAEPCSESSPAASTIALTREDDARSSLCYSSDHKIFDEASMVVNDTSELCDGIGDVDISLERSISPTKSVMDVSPTKSSAATVSLDDGPGDIAGAIKEDNEEEAKEQQETLEPPAPTSEPVSDPTSSRNVVSL